MHQFEQFKQEPGTNDPTATPGRVELPRLLQRAASMSEQKPLIDWLGQPIAVPQSAKPDKDTNPCIALYGPGPDGQTCKNCSLIAGLGLSKTYYKCRIRKNTHSAKTDHKLKWQACAKFEQREAGQDIPLYDGRG